MLFKDFIISEAKKNKKSKKKKPKGLAYEKGAVSIKYPSMWVFGAYRGTSNNYDNDSSDTSVSDMGDFGGDGGGDGGGGE